MSKKKKKKKNLWILIHAITEKIQQMVERDHSVKRVLGIFSSYGREPFKKVSVIIHNAPSVLQTEIGPELFRPSMSRLKI